MAFVIADRVRETTTTIGTGSVTLGGAYTSFQTFSAAIGNGNNTYYTIASASSGEWEVGIGTYTSGGNLLSRDTVLASSNAGNLVNFSVGSKDVFVTQPSERSLLINSGSTGLFAGNAAFTANGIPYANSTTTLTTGSALTFDGVDFTSGNGGIIAKGASSLASGAGAYLYYTSGTTSAELTALNPGVAWLNQKYSALTHIWNNSGSEAMRLTSTGLGIGTSSPTAAKLHVAGYNGGSVYPIRMTSTNAGVEWAFETGGTNAATSFFAIRDIGNSSTPLTINSSGNLGIGTSSPYTKLDVSGSAGMKVYFTGGTDGNSAGSIVLGDGLRSANYVGLYRGTSISGGAASNALSLGAFEAIRFCVSATTLGSQTEQMRLDSSGNLGLGVTPSAWNGSFFKTLEGGDSNNQSYVGFRTDANTLNIGTNNFFNTSNQYVYKFNGAASRFDINADNFAWSLAASGNAGDPISFAQAMTLTSLGNLLVNTTSDDNSKVRIKNFYSFGSKNTHIFIDGGDISNTGVVVSGGYISQDVIGGIRLEQGGTYYGAGLSKTDSVSTTYSSAGFNDGNIRFFTNTGLTASTTFTPTERMRLDSSGNLGLGVTPSAWGSLKALQLANGVSLASYTGGAQPIAYLTSGTYFNGTSWIYAISSSATAKYELDQGAHKWFTAPSGTAGNAITFTQAMTLDASGNLLLGTTTTAYATSGRGLFEVNGSSTSLMALKTGDTARGYFAASSAFTEVAAAGASQPLLFTTNGSERARIDSSGNFGLGVTPSAWGGAYTKAFQMSGSGGLVNNQANDIHLFNNCYYNGTNWIYDTTNPSSRYEQFNGGHYWFTAPSGTAGNAISFTQAMTLDASGNLLVGTTTSPGSPNAQIVAAGTTDPGIQLASTSNGGGLILGAGGGGIGLYTYTGAIGSESYSERARIDSSGNLLVGTTSASTRFTLNVSGANDGITLRTTNEGAIGQLGMVNPGSNNDIQIGTLGVNNLRFFTNGTANERARITSGGDFGLGVTSPGAKLDVYSSSTTAGTPIAFFGKELNSNATSNVLVQFLINFGGTGSGQINADGASAAAFGTYSDARLKENIVSLPPQLANICALRPVEFDYKDGSGHQIGFVAQEMQTVYPDVVGSGNDEMLTVTGWSKTEARLVKAIQELKAEVDSLKAQLKGA